MRLVRQSRSEVADLAKAAQAFIETPLYEAFIAYIEQEERIVYAELTNINNPDSAIRVAQGRAYALSHAKMSFRSMIRKSDRLARKAEMEETHV